jgi:hypothetical protein
MMEKRVMHISIAAAAAVAITAMAILTYNQSWLSNLGKNNGMVATEGENQSTISSSQQAAAQALAAGQVFARLVVVAWDPGAAEGWIKIHPEDFSNEVILDDSILVQSSALQNALQSAVEKKYDHGGPGAYYVDPLATSDLNSIVSIIGASKFTYVQSSTESNFNEKSEVIGKVLVQNSRALVKYGDDYLWVTIFKTTTL